MKTYFRLWQSLGRARLLVAAILAFSFGINVFSLAVPIYMMQVYDRVLTSLSGTTLLVLTGITLVTLSAYAILDAARHRLMTRLGLKLDRALCQTVFASLIATAAQPDSNRHPQALRDLDTVRGFISSPSLTGLMDSPWVLVFVVILYMLHPAFAGICLAGAAVLILVAILQEVLTKEHVRESMTAGIKANEYAELTLRNAEAAEAMGMGRSIAGEWRKHHDRSVLMQVGVSDREAGLHSLSRFVRLCVQVTILGIGAWLVIDRQITGGMIMAGSILSARALAPVEVAVGMWKSFLSFRLSWERLLAMLERAPKRHEGMELPRPKGTLAVEEAVFGLPALQRPILNRVSFALPAGETLAIIGPSGSGKSTLARLLVGVWCPLAGKVRLDGADVYQWKREDFGRHVGYLPQDVELFGGTVRENIERFAGGEPAAVVAAAELAGAHDLILRLPKGYDTDIGEAGARLSGGQRQRIALARAVYGRPALVVLDEPNSNLDSDGEDALRRAMTALRSAGSTVVIVSHRPSSITTADKLLVLREGTVEAFGPRAEVLARMTRPAVGPVQVTAGA